MLTTSRPADPRVHETAIAAARRCRHIIQVCLREEEWTDADREFYLVIREELERFVATSLQGPAAPDSRIAWDGEKTTIVGDDDVSWVAPAYREMHRLLKDDGFIVTFYGWPHSDVFVGTFKQLGFRIVSHLAFVKNVWGLGRFTRGQHETAYLLAKGRPEAPNPAGSDVIEWMREKDAAHPNQKPVSALYPLIE
ncbi:hypothetical protein HK102_011784, partial [Quaeritorhiza haematococci]